MTEVFEIVPAQGREGLFIVGFVALVLVGVMVLLFATMRGGHASRFEVSAEGLRLRGDLWGRRIPASAIRGAEARLVDLSASPELAPSWRTAGTALVSYNSGWFRLKNGEKALLYLTDRHSVAYIPTTLGYSLLLSPRHADRFVARVKEIAGGQ
jgi:hypothetical protein